MKLPINQIICGDCLEVMREWPDQSVNCCVTSPPYWGLRDYGVDGQLGLESTPEEFVSKMVEVFREVRRVLRDDGTLWLNLGDSYAQSQAMRNRNGITEDFARPCREHVADEGRKLSHGLKPKDLCGIPWRVAFALQADGWYLRQDIIWKKPNPMPESVTDRCTKAHEYIFLLTKKARYWYDAEAIREPHSQAIKDGVTRDMMETEWATKRESKGKVQKDTSGKTNQGGTVNRNKNYYGNPAGRNKRSVWTVTTKPYSEAHFATFPPDLIKPCILAGCPKGGVVLDPFMGSGTTAEVAAKNQRDYVGCELNPEYMTLNGERAKAADTGVPVKEARKGQLPLFS